MEFVHQKATLTAQCAHCAWGAKATMPPIEAAAFLRKLLLGHVQEQHAETTAGDLSAQIMKAS